MADTFKKQKLSRKAIDEFASKYADKSAIPQLTPYTLANGDQIRFNQADAMIKRMARILLLNWSNFSFS